MEDFEWRDIPGEPGYQVSNYGQVKSLERIIDRENNTPRRVPMCILRPGRSKSGHLSVVLGRNNTKQIHRLVLLAFEGPPATDQEVLHLDHNPGNNRKSNLRYGTRSENLMMDYTSGATRQAKRVVAQYPEGLRVEYPNITAAAKALGVSQPAASIAAKDGHPFRHSKVRLHYVD